MGECSCGKTSGMQEGAVHTPAVCWYVAPNSTWDDQMIRDQVEEYVELLNGQHAELTRLRAVAEAAEQALYMWSVENEAALRAALRALKEGR